MTVLLLACASAALPAASPARPRGGSVVALVTAETENAVLVVSLPEGKVLRRLSVAPDPQNVTVGAVGPAVVVSTKGRAVTFLAWRTLRVVRVIHGFAAPHLAAIAPDGEWVYVTDDRTGLVWVVELARMKVVARVFVGIGAHHLSFSPDERRLWVALGERARTIVVLDTSHPNQPRVVARFHPGFPAHDLAFSPDGRRVWITSATGTRVSVLDAASRHLLFTVGVGLPPQHVAFGEVTHDAYLTSGYASRIERVDERSGRVLGSAVAPHGSFNVTTSGSLVVTSSLLNGTVTEFTDRLRLFRKVRVAPAARDVGISVW